MLRSHLLLLVPIANFPLMIFLSVLKGCVQFSLELLALNLSGMIAASCSQNTFHTNISLVVSGWGCLGFLPPSSAVMLRSSACSRMLLVIVDFVMFGMMVLFKSSV